MSKGPGWYNNSYGHRLAAKGVKTTPEGMYIEADGVKLKWVKQDKEVAKQLIMQWKNDYAKQKALEFLNMQDTRPLVVTKDQVVWGLGGKVTDKWGNDWKHISIYDRPFDKDPLEGTIAINMSPHYTNKDFNYLNMQKGVTNWKIIRNPLVASSSTFAPLVSTLGIKVKGIEFSELRQYYDEINVRVNKTLKRK